MKTKIIFYLLLIPLFSLAQTSMKWEQAIGGPGIEYGYSVKSCLNQGYIVAGSTASNGISDGYLVRTDSLGLVMWSKYFRGNNVDVYRSVKILPDSGFIVAGFSNSAGTHGGYDGFVERVDKNGDSLWSEFIGTSNWDFFYDITPTYDGGFILAGGTYGAGMGDEDFYLVKIDAVGNIIWTRTYGGAKQDEARAIIQTGDSMIAVVGFTFSLGDSLGDSWILRLTQWGGTVWTRTINQPTFEDKGWGIADLYSLGRIMFVGESSAVHGDPDAYVEAMNYNGDSLFNLNFGGAATVDNFMGIVTRPNATFACLGTTENNQAGGHGDFWFFHDRNGFVSRMFGTLSPEAGYSIDLAHDDGYIACGFTEGFNLVLANVYLVKIDTNGMSTALLAIRELPSPSSIGSVTVFPNPAQNQVFINYDSNEPIGGRLNMEVWDIAGRKIMEIPSSQWQFLSSKSVKCEIETSSLNNGIYQLVISDKTGAKCSGKFIVAH
jgi:hypothetical protein